MLSLAQEHFSQTRALAEGIDKDILAKWLLNEGYYPEQYVLPPCFHVEKFMFKDAPYYDVISENGNVRYRPSTSELINIFFPKSYLTDRTFGIIEPRICHDIAWLIVNNWGFVIDHLFHTDIQIYSYSFPIPVTDNEEGALSTLRSGRMIYEFIEMAENDLVADAHKYQIKVETDVKNFYPSIYTHSLPWALHGKEPSRNDHNYELFGNRLDKLFQNSNDRCTNGLAIGPVVSDIASEIILSSIDRKCSEELRGIDFLAVRFKDDYKILCNSEKEAQDIIKCLQRQMRLFNLTLNEGKTEIKELPEGLFRPWILEYQSLSLKKTDSISYKEFETTLLAVLKIDKKFPDTGIIDKFLSELVTKDYKLKLTLEQKQIFKTFSLLFLLKKRRARSFPQILAIIELIIERFKNNTDLIDIIFGDVRQHLEKKSDYLYDDLWISYFLRSQGRDFDQGTSLDNNLLLRSIFSNKQEFYNSSPEISLFASIEDPGKNKLLARHLAIFPKDEE